MSKRAFIGFFLANVVGFAISTPAFSQSTPAAADDPVRLQPIIVNVYKEANDAQRLPVSVTGVSSTTLTNTGVRSISEAAVSAPNTFFSEFTARKLSNARFRGISSSPSNPGITTYIDGVPQLSTNSSNIEFMDVDQVEFVRGPQSALFGRNTLGGLVQISSRPPSSKWTGSFSAPVGNYGQWDVRGSASGPVTEKLGVSLFIGRGKRDGFTRNDVTGNDLDHRSTSYGKAQLRWTPTSEWETRLIVTGERARDGDYALNDLAALRANPFHASRDFEGYTNRDVLSGTLQARREGQRVAFSTTTGIVKWKTQDVTDLDYSPRPLVTRDNSEKDLQFTQELRIASAAAAPARLSDNVSLRWQTGVFFFTQNYDQDAINNFAPGLLSPQLPFPISQHSPQSALDDRGIGVYGQGTAIIKEKVDLTVGARVDHEKKEATLNTFYSPAFAPANNVVAEKGFSNVSPRFSATYHFQTGRMAYASVDRGFKAGGFNPASPAGNEAYGEEQTWHIESGIKSSLAGGRATAGLAFFYIDWDALQLNLPNPAVPAQFYIANIGGARSKGVELELSVRPHRYLDLFASAGLTHARFRDGSSSSGMNVSGNSLPSTPDYTAAFGGQFSRTLGASTTLYGTAEVSFNGGFQYDDANTRAQEAFSLTNFRGGVRGKYVFAEAWVRNAFDTRYIPIAFAYSSFAPSGFVGEMGAPRRYGINFGVGF
jgi:iron complex outermembrane receptor protein